MANQIEIWKAFIEAQEILLEAYSSPFYLKKDSLEKLKDNQYKAQVDTQIIFKKAEDLINCSFPDLPKECVDWENGIIKKPESTNINDDGFKKLKETGSSYHLYVNTLPSVTFKVKSNVGELDVFESIIGRRPLTTGNIAFLMSSEIQQILNSNSRNLELLKPFGAVFTIQPSVEYFQDCKQSLARLLELNEKDIKSNIQKGNLTVYNKKIETELINDIENSLPYKAQFIEIAVKVVNNEAIFNSQNDYWRKALGIYWSDETEITDPSIILPHPRKQIFYFQLECSISEIEFFKRINNLRLIFREVFGEENFEIQFRTKFILQLNSWWSTVKPILSSKGFNVNSSASIVSFDFNDDLYLQELRRNLLIDKLVYSNDNGYNHLYKVRYNFINTLGKIQEVLKTSIPHISLHYSTNQQSLVCAYQYNSGYDNEHEKLIAVKRVNQAIKTLTLDNFEIELPKIEIGYDEYSFDFRIKDGLKELENHIKKLRNEEFGVKINKQFESIGIIKKVEFPFIYFETLKPINTEILNSQLFGNLKGEQDRIKRLSTTIDKIYTEEKNSCVNQNIKAIIKDSSKAKGKDDLERLQIFKDKIDEVNATRLNKLLNEKQLEAVTKSLFAEDVFFIQGPPGTGKSTGISEIVWQHLRQNQKQKILITSETNLAVDNALDKLRSNKHNLIKPIRFGSEEKLDKEGRRFSYQLIENWVAQEEQTDIDYSDQEEEANAGNVIEEWIGRISKYSGWTDNKDINKNLISNWRHVLDCPTPGIKSIFFSNYLKAVNVVGATSSSIGKKSSTGAFTIFYRDYCNIYHNGSLQKFKDGIASGDKTLIASGVKSLNKEDIYFDLIIQDEASKASPPEMAIPMVYAKKSIIIGDHRQLPPMIDTNEFIDDISLVAEKSGNNDLVRRSRKLIKQIQNNRDDFSIAHFENMYKNIDASLKSALNIQYRMHPAINSVISQFYPVDPQNLEYGLFCGLNEKFVDDNNIGNPQSRFHGIQIPGFIDCNHHIVWVNVDSPEIILGTSRYNIGEVDVIKRILNLLSQNQSFMSYQANWNNKEDKQIGIISFYGAQLSKLKELNNLFPQIPMRISTVDRFQGMERNIIIVSTVRSNKIVAFENQDLSFSEQQDSLGFAEFPNRLNVALSRAKRLLIIVGNAEHFTKKSIYSNVVDIIKESQFGLFIQGNEI